jgi:Protein of unknown function (DUF1236)
MSTNKLMMAVATAALIAGPSTVLAQQGSPSGQNKAGQTTSQAAPGGATHNGAAENKGGKNAGEERSESNSNRAGAAEPNRRETTGQAAPQNGRSQQNERRESQSNERRENRSEQNKAQNRAGEDRRLDQNRRSEERNVDQNRRTEQRNNVNERERATEHRGNVREKERDRTTTGQGAAGSRASVVLTPEKRTEVHELIVKERNAPRMDRVDFNLSVGSKVPRSVRFVPVPSRIVEIEPSWRGYEYFMVGDQIVIVDPRSMEIVAVIAA